MRCHSVEALLCKAHRYLCQGLLEAWINECFFNCLWGSILEYWHYFEMKSRKNEHETYVLFLWGIEITLYDLRLSSGGMLCTNIRKQKDINAIEVWGKRQVTASQLYQGKKQDLKIQNMIFVICRGCFLDYWAIPCGLCQQETNFSFVTVSQLTPVTLHEG